MTDIQKGIPEISKANGNFKLGRKTAKDILEAGPGHHTVVEFDCQEDEGDITAFVGGCRYVANDHSALKVARRTVKKEGLIKVYVVHE